MNEAPKALAPMDFSTFVLSLGSSAMVNLGQVPAPGQDKPIVDLPAAKQIIDILSLLEDKTKGNLDVAEKKLLDGLIYDLRIKFVDASNRAREAASPDPAKPGSASSASSEPTDSE